MIFDIILQAKKLIFIEILFRYTKINVLQQILVRSGATNRKWPVPEPELELRSFENLAPEQEPEPLKFSRFHQPCPRL